MSRLAGHALLSDGMPYDIYRVRIRNWHGGVAASGRALCSCGELSDVLRSTARRKQWHREHKRAIREQGGPR